MTLVLVPQLVPTPPGEPTGGKNCNPSCGATCVIHATGGAKRPSGADVRRLCLEPDGDRDVTEGTNLRQVADAIERGWGVEMEVVTPEDYTRFRSRMQKEPNTVASVSVSYAAFLGTKAYASRSGFRGNHQVVVRWVGGKEPWEMVDPLADGERGVPKAPVRITDALLRKAAGSLVLSKKVNGRLVSWPLGAGSIYAGYVKGPAAPKPTKHSIVFTPGSIHVYNVQGGVANSRREDGFTKRTSAPCDAPESIPYPTATSARKKLARITAGRLKGQYVEPGRAHVQLVSK